MPTLSHVAAAALALLCPMSIAAQTAGTSAPGDARPAPVASNPYPVAVQLSTLVDHPGQFARQLVQLPASRVERIVSPGLVELMDAREHGPYHFHVFYRPDRLLVLLPTNTRVARGDVILAAGVVRTVRGAVVTQELSGPSAEKLKKEGNRPVVVAASATTIDGASLAGAGTSP